MTNSAVHYLWTVSWQVTVVAGVIWLVTRAARNAPASWRFGLWLIVLVKFIVPPFVLLPAGIVPWLAHDRQVAQATGVDSDLLLAREVKSGNARAYSLPSDRSPADSPGNVRAKSGESSDWLPKIVVVAWLFSAAFGLIALGFRYRAQCLLLSGGRPGGERLVRLLNECGERLGMRRLPAVALSDLLAAPVLLGLTKPTILLPADIAHGDNNQSALRAILLHELSHVKRRDLVVVWLHQVVRVVFCFHPVLHLAWRELMREREQACDEMVLSSLSIAPRDYAAGYLSALRMAGRASALPLSLAMCEPFDVEKKRLTRMFRSSLPRFSTGLAVCLVLAAAVCLPTIAGVRQGVTALSQAASARGLAHSPWPKFGGNARNTGLGTGCGASGKLQWVARTGSPIGGGPVIGPDGSVYVLADDGYLHAFAGRTGQLRWKIDIRRPGSKELMSILESSPAIGATGTIYTASTDGALSAIDTATGKKLWVFRAGKRIHSSPAIAPDSAVIFSSYDGYIYALEGGSGRLRWKFRTGNHSSSSGAIGLYNDVYIGAGATLYSLNIKTGRMNWQFTTGGAGIYPSVADDGTVYVGSPSRVYAIDGRTGSKKWEFGVKNVAWPLPVIGPDGTVYAGSWDHHLYALHPRTGKLKWSKDVGEIVHRPPAVASDGTVYVGAKGPQSARSRRHTASDGTVYVGAKGLVLALDGKTGRTRMSLQVDSYHSSFALGADGTLYVGTDNGVVYAYR